METKVISGKELAQLHQLQMKDRVEMLYNKYGRKPKLAVILVGDDAGSVSYVKGKEKACINNYRTPKKTSENFYKKSRIIF